MFQERQSTKEIFRIETFKINKQIKQTLTLVGSVTVSANTECIPHSNVRYAKICAINFAALVVV